MSRNNSSIVKGAAYIITAACIYGLFTLLSRTVGLNIPIFFQNATRSLTAALILAVIVTMQHAWKKVAARDLRIMFIRAVAGSVAFLSFFYTIIKVPVGPAYFLFYAGSTLFGFIFGHFWFSEHLTKPKIFSLGLAFAGLLMVYQVNTSVVSPFYFALAIFSGATTAVWDVISKKLPSQYSPSYIALWDEFIAVPAYCLISLIIGEPWTLPALTPVWAASLGLGIFFVMTGMLIVIGYRYVEAQIGTILTLAEIPFAIFFGWLFYREFVSPLTTLGGVLVIAAIILPEIYAGKKSSRIE